MNLTNRSFLKLLDYTPEEIEGLLDHDTDSSVAARFMFKKAGVRLTPYQPSGRKMELEL